MVTVDQYVPVGHSLGKERRLQFRVIEIDDVNRTSDYLRQLRGEIDDPLKAPVAQSTSTSTSLPGASVPRAVEPKQQSEAHVRLCAQSCAQHGEQSPGSANILALA